MVNTVGLKLLFAIIDNNDEHIYQSGSFKIIYVLSHTNVCPYVEGTPWASHGETWVAVCCWSLDISCTTADELTVTAFTEWMYTPHSLTRTPIQHKQRGCLANISQSAVMHRLLLETDNVLQATRLYPELVPLQTITWGVCLILTSVPFSSSLNHKSCMPLVAHTYTLPEPQSHVERSSPARVLQHVLFHPTGFHPS